MAILIRRFVAGRMTNFAFEDTAVAIANRAPADPALHEIVFRGLWFLYDDIREHTLAPLAGDQRRTVARMLLFLRTDDPYCWSSEQDVRPFAWSTSLFDAITQLVTGVFVPSAAGLRLVIWLTSRHTPMFIAPHTPERSREADIWPFTSRGSLTLARHNIRFIGGMSPCSTL